MSKALNLAEMDMPQLKELRAQLEVEIMKAERRELDEAKEALYAVAHRMKMPLRMLLERTGLMKEISSTKGAGEEKAKQQRKPPTFQYVHPHDKSLAWLGRGKHPAWLKELMAQPGASLDSLKVPL